MLGQLWRGQAGEDQEDLSGLSLQTRLSVTTDQEVFYQTLSNYAQPSSVTGLLLLLLLDLLVGLLQVVWRGDPAEDEGGDQHCSDQGLQHPVLQ